MHRFIRFANRIYAFIFRKFWLPCPVCGEYFGGHEIGAHSVPITCDPNYGRVTCNKSDCQAAAKKITDVALEQHIREVKPKCSTQTFINPAGIVQTIIYAPLPTWYDGR